MKTGRYSEAQIIAILRQAEGGVPPAVDLAVGSSYAPQGETVMNLDLLLLIDKQFLETSFYCVWQMTWHRRTKAMP